MSLLVWSFYASFSIFPGFLAEAIGAWNAACLPAFPRVVPAAPGLALLQELELPSVPFLQTRTPLFLPQMKLETSQPAEGFIRKYFSTACPCLPVPQGGNDNPPGGLRREVGSKALSQPLRSCESGEPNTHVLLPDKIKVSFCSCWGRSRPCQVPKMLMRPQERTCLVERTRNLESQRALLIPRGVTLGKSGCPLSLPWRVDGRTMRQY